MYRFAFVEAPDWRFECHGKQWVHALNSTLTQDGLMVTISSSDNQEWIWQRDGGLQMKNSIKEKFDSQARTRLNSRSNA